MPSIALLAPVLLPLIAAGVITVSGLSGFNLGRIAAGAGALVAVIALLGLWLPVRSSQELNFGQLGFGSPFALRIDAVAFAFGLMVLVPSALLLTFQRRTWQEATVGVLGMASAMVPALVNSTSCPPSSPARRFLSASSGCTSSRAWACR